MLNNFLKRYFVEIILILFASIFSSWLMWHTFSYKDGSMIIATKVWSDFASHIPLIRSFSYGYNFPPEYPLFSGEPIRYHFLFYMWVGLLEKMGLRIDYALNILSSLSFTLLLFSIYLLAKTLFKSRGVGILSTIFFLFNGSLSFLEFFKTHPISLKIMGNIITNTEYPSFAPYGPGVVSAFWNLNIYTNQRHLALSLSLLLLIILWIIKNEQNNKSNKSKILAAALCGILFGLLLYTHSSIFIMALSLLGILFLSLPKQSLLIIIIGVIGALAALPRVIFLAETANFIPQIKLGYLITDNLNIINFLKYWFLNLGLFWFLVAAGFILSNALSKKILIAFFSLFIIGNTIQFSPEIAGNHKFFNVFVIVGNMFAAFTLVKLWKLNYVFKFFVPTLIFFFIFSGIIDFFPLKNDRFMTIDDYPKNPDIFWIINNTPKDAVFLNSSYLYHPASLAGRKIFYGWPYFAWSAGHDTYKRAQLVRDILSSHDKENICNLLVANNLSFIELDQPSADFPFSENFWQMNFQPIYKNPSTDLKIYRTDDICHIT